MGEQNSKLGAQSPGSSGSSTSNPAAAATPRGGIGEPGSPSYYEAERARMLHMRTRDQIEYDRSHDYHVEADRILNLYHSNNRNNISSSSATLPSSTNSTTSSCDNLAAAAGTAAAAAGHNATQEGLPKHTPPLIKSSAKQPDNKDILTSRKEKMADEVLHHSQLFSPNRIPSDAALRAFAQFQTLSMREGIAAHKTQEELNVLMKHTASQVHQLQACAQHELSQLHAMEVSLMEAERLRQDVNMLESLVDDVVPLLDEIDEMMSAQDREELKAERKAAKAKQRKEEKEEEEKEKEEQDVG